MAKKRSGGGINMAAETRKLLTSNPNLAGRQVYEALCKKFPNLEINESSSGVAFSGARKKLGIVPAETASRKKKSGKKVVRRKKPTLQPQTADLSALKAAAKYIAEVGDANQAIVAIKQLQSLQIR